MTLSKRNCNLKNLFILANRVAHRNGVESTSDNGNGLNLKQELRVALYANLIGIEYTHNAGSVQCLHIDISWMLLVDFDSPTFPTPRACPLNVVTRALRRQHYPSTKFARRTADVTQTAHLAPIPPPSTVTCASSCQPRLLPSRLPQSVTLTSTHLRSPCPHCRTTSPTPSTSAPPKR